MGAAPSLTSAHGSAARLTFDRITAPIGRERFLASYWTRQAVHLRHDGRSFDDVFGWDALNAILSAHDLTSPAVKMSRSDHPVPPETFTRETAHGRALDTTALIELFREGASFGVTGADSHWAPLRRVKDGLYDVLLESIHTNVYCSPPNTQGFQCHYDTHEVFVLQVEGEKHWRVFWPTTDAPVQGWRVEDTPEGVEPYVDVVLRKGDVLYVPRGHWHYAVAQDSISLHITAGVACRKGSAFLDWLSDELQQSPIWRRNAPLMEAARSNGTLTIPASFAEWTEALKSSLREKLSEPGLVERFWKATFDGIRPRQAFDLPLQAGLDTWPLETLVFERPAGRRHLIAATDESTLDVNAGGCELELEAVDRALVQKIFDAESFTMADVRAWQPDVNAADISELLRELVRAGLLDARRAG